MNRRRINRNLTIAQAPISDLNTTPLIDVMLVLLIMFIITIPIMAHKVPLDLPIDRPGGPPPVVHQLAIDEAGRIRLDGTAMNESDLPPRLGAIQADSEAVLHLKPSGATRYEDFDRVLAIVKRAGITRIGMIDNKKHAEAWSAQ